MVNQRKDQFHVERKLQIGTIASLVIAMASLLWQTAAWKTETHDRLVVLEKTVAKNSETLHDVHTKVSRIEAALPYMRGSLDRIRLHLDGDERQRATRAE